MVPDTTLRELLTDLRHDLAKYLCLPIRMLPRDADAATLRYALERALLFTRQGPHETLTAREIYTRARVELANAGAPLDMLSAIDAATECALAWHSALDGQRALDRASIERDFIAVASAIDAFIDHTIDEGALD